MDETSTQTPLRSLEQKNVQKRNRKEKRLGIEKKQPRRDCTKLDKNRTKPSSEEQDRTEESAIEDKIIAWSRIEEGGQEGQKTERGAIRGKRRKGGG